MKIIDPETKSVLVFKGGIVIVEKSFILSTGKGEVYLEKPKYALKGSFWISTSIPDVIKQMEVCEFEEILPKKKVECDTIFDQLRALVGKENVVSLKFSKENEEKVTGQVVKLKTNTVTIYNQETKTFIVRKVGDVDGIISEQPIPDEFEELETSEKKERIKITYDCQNENVVATMGYWRREMSFVPSYRLQISDDFNQKTGIFSMQASLVNRGQGLNKISQITLAGGNPNIEFGEVSDIFLKPIEEGGNNRGGWRRQQNPFQDDDVALEQDDCLTPIADDIGDPFGFGGKKKEEEEGEGETISVSDTCFYLKENITSPEKSRVLLPIFTHVVPISEVYVCDLKESDIPLPVSHFFKLKNTTQFPWTAGTAILASPGQRNVFSQGQMNFTPRGRTAEIEHGKSLSMKIYFRESVVETKSVGQTKYSLEHLVTMKAEVELSNREMRREAPAEVVIRFSFEGELVSSELEKSLKKNEKLKKSSGGSGKNLKITKLRYKLQAKKGETIKFGFVYNKFVTSSK